MRLFYFRHSSDNESKLIWYEDGKIAKYDTAATVEPGERVAQLAIVPFLHADFEEADELSATVRGEGGFGSTGRK